MKNRHDLKQLENDAKKQGAWEAKLAYATYLLKYDVDESAEKKDIALAYLHEIISNDIQAYLINARNLLEYFNESFKTNAVARSAIADIKIANERYIYYINSYSKSSGSPEFLYKKIRYKYDQLHYTNEQTMASLEGLLAHEEMTDTLRAKIYFQLIRLNIEQASIKGQRFHLEEAKKYCLLLTNDPTLSSLFKAQEAARVYNQIKPITDKPIYDFTALVKNSFDVGKTISKQIFKYAGIVVGNVIDFAMLGFPKAVGKNLELARGYARKGKTLSEEVFKNNGFAVLFKSAGKLFGRHIIGNLITGPIGAILGMMTYPFKYVYNKYKSSQEIQNRAKDVIDLDKNKKSIGNVHANKIFAHKNSDHPYGNIDSLGEELTQPVRVCHESLFLLPGKEQKAMYAYGRLFSRNMNSEKQENVPEPFKLTPIAKKQ